MTEKWKDEAWAQDYWYDGKVTRRRLIGWGGGAIGAMMLVPAPWRAAFGAAKPYKIGSEQPLSGAGAAGGKTAVVGLQMAADRINKNGGINGRPVELVIADDESPARRRAPQDAEDGVGGRYRRPRRRLPLQYLPCLHAGLGAGQDRQHDQRVPRHHADHHQLQPLQLPPARLRAGAGGRLRRRRSSRWARSGTSPMPIIPGASRRATPMPSEIKKSGGEVVGTTGIPLGTADMTPFLSKISGNFDGLFGIFFGKDGVTIGNQAYDLGLTKKYKWAGDGSICEFDQPAGARQQDRRLCRHQPLHPGVRGAARHALSQGLLRRSQGAAGQDRSVRPAARPLRAVELRSHERAEDRHGEVEIRRPQGHHEADRGARRLRDEGRATTSRKATRRCARPTTRPS